jgi:hypothetical protein
MPLKENLKNYSTFKAKEIWKWTKNWFIGIAIIILNPLAILYYTFRLIVGILALILTNWFFNVIRFSLVLFIKLLQCKFIRDTFFGVGFVYSYCKIKLIEFGNILIGRQDK